MIKKAIQNKVFQKDLNQVVILSGQGVKVTKKTATVLDAKEGDQLWYGWNESDNVILFKDTEHRGKLNSKLVLNISGLNDALLAKTGLDKIEGYRSTFNVSDVQEESDGTNTIQVVELTFVENVKITPEEAKAEEAEVKTAGKAAKKVAEPASVE